MIGGTPFLFWSSDNPPSYRAVNVTSSAIACPFRRVGIPSPTCRNYRGTSHVLSPGPPSAIISPSSRHLCISLMSFAVPSCSASPLRLHSPPPSPSSRNIFLTQSSLLFSSSSAFLPLYVCLLPPLPSLSNPSSFSVAPLSVLYSNPPASCHHISVTPASLPPFYSRHHHNILSLHPYPPPPSQYHYYLFLSIYLSISSHSLYLSSLSHSLYLYFYFSSTS